MNKKISVLLALALTVSALSGCNMASGKNPDDLRVDREGGDHKHEYGEVSETAAVTTAATTEETTAASSEETTTTTTTETAKPSLATQGVLHSKEEAYDLACNALGKDFDTAYSIIENTFASQFTLTNYEEHSPEIDSYPDTLFEYEYSCDVVIYGFGFDTVSIWCDENNRAIEISYCYHSSDTSRLKNYYDYFRADLPLIFGSPVEEDNESDYVLYTSYGPLNGVGCTVTYMYWGDDDNEYNMAVLGFGLDR